VTRCRPHHTRSIVDKPRFNVEERRRIIIVCGGGQLHHEPSAGCGRQETTSNGVVPLDGCHPTSRITTTIALLRLLLWRLLYLNPLSDGTTKGQQGQAQAAEPNFRPLFPHGNGLEKTACDARPAQPLGIVGQEGFRAYQETGRRGAL
jgi:hypothetical protein